MIFDVETAERSAFDRDFDVCVIGAGPAGITLARRLAARGFDVALMEGGGLEWSEESQDVAVGESVGLAYPDLDVARVRCFGGSSGHWNGLCRAFEAADMRPRPQNPSSGWPIGRADLDPYQAEVAEILDLVPDWRRRPAGDPRAAGGRLPPGLVPAQRPDPVRREVSRRDQGRRADRARDSCEPRRPQARRQPDPRRPGAVFRGYAADDPGFTVRARSYCLCTGGLENPRLLLNFTSQLPAGIGNQNDLVGRYFCDHLRMQVGEAIFSEVPDAEVRYFTPTEEFLAEHRTLKIVLHLDYYRRKTLSLPKELARSAQCAVPFAERLVAAVAGEALQCDRGGLEDYLASRDPEQNPWGRGRDQQRAGAQPREPGHPGRGPGRLRPAAHPPGLADPGDRQPHHPGHDPGLRGPPRRAERRPGAPLRLHSRRPADPGERRRTGSRLSGWHQMCTTRMSDDPKTGVVDRNCRVHGIANLYIGGSSVFATPGFQNPTYTIVQLALRLGDHLAETMPAGAPPLPEAGGDE